MMLSVSATMILLLLLVTFPGNSAKVDGGWSQWSHYGSCSKTCGGGVKAARRMCINPEPANGGKECLGCVVTLDECNTNPCPGPLMAIGGWDGNSKSSVRSSAEVLKTSCDFPLPVKRKGHISVTTTDGKTLVCGGYYAGYKASCFQFDYESKSWKNHTSLLSKHRNNAAAVILSSGVYVLGGDIEAKTTSEFLATGSSVWTQGPNIPGKGFSAACVAKLSDTEFVILGNGGRNGTEVYVYNEVRDEWREWSPLSVRLYGQSCVGLGDKVLMAGGSFWGQTTGRTFVFDTKTGSGREVTSLKYTRAFAVMRVIDGKAVILGGYSQGNGWRTDGEMWNKYTEKWEKADIRLSMGRERFSLVNMAQDIDCN